MNARAPRPTSRARGCAAVALLAASVAGAASAQDAPGAADQHAEAVAQRHDENDVRVLLTAGSALAYGNSRNLAINAGAQFVLRMDEHAFGAQLNWIYGLASQRDATTMEFGPWSDSANNLTWKLRYDAFLTPDDALFAVHVGRRDPFAQLEPRIGLQAGYMRNVFREENHRFWVEIGYDFTYDHFPMELQVGVDDMNMPVMSDDRSLHSLRLFIGYDNRLNEVLTYTTGLEALMRFDRPEHWRFEWINQLRSKLADWLQISLDLTGRLDSLPPGQVEAWNEQPMQPTQMLDVLVTLNLVGTFDLYSEPEEDEEEEEESECEPCVCPEPRPCPASEEAPVTEPATETPVEEPTSDAAVEEPAGAAVEEPAAAAVEEPAAGAATEEPAAEEPTPEDAAAQEP